MAPCPASLLLTHSQATRPLPETYSPTLTHMALVGLHAQNMLQFVREGYRAQEDARTMSPTSTHPGPLYLLFLTSAEHGRPARAQRPAELCAG